MGLYACGQRVAAGADAQNESVQGWTMRAGMSGKPEGRSRESVQDPGGQFPRRGKASDSQLLDIHDRRGRRVCRDTSGESAQRSVGQ
jgi:hypothetical protein